jgi:hypothetical protein
MTANKWVRKLARTKASCMRRRGHEDEEFNVTKKSWTLVFSGGLLSRHWLGPKLLNFHGHFRTRIKIKKIKTTAFKNPEESVENYRSVVATRPWVLFLMRLFASVSQHHGKTIFSLLLFRLWLRSRCFTNWLHSSLTKNSLTIPKRRSVLFIHYPTSES